MKKYIALLVIVLAVATLYFGLKESGLLAEFDNAIHERDGWHQVGAQYVKYETVTRQFIYYSLLKDPEFGGDFRVLEGAIKKAAVDRMQHIKRSTYEVTGKTDDVVKENLKLIAGYMNCNTVIIDGRFNSVETQKKGFGIIGFGKM